MFVDNEELCCSIWNEPLTSSFDASGFPVVTQHLQPFSHRACLAPTSPRTAHFGQHCWPQGCHHCHDFWILRLQAPATCLPYRGWRSCSSGSGLHTNPSITSSAPKRKLKHPAADTLWALLINVAGWYTERPKLKFCKAQRLSPPHWVLRQKRVSELHCILIAPIQLNIKWRKQLYIANGKQAFSEAVRHRDY